MFNHPDNDPSGGSGTELFSDWLASKQLRVKPHKQTICVPIRLCRKPLHRVLLTPADLANRLHAAVLELKGESAPPKAIASTVAADNAPTGPADVALILPA